jgi:hypothetical protein
VQQFRKLVDDEESSKVLEQARKSRAENPNGIKPWKVTVCIFSNLSSPT